MAREKLGCDRLESRRLLAVDGLESLAMERSVEPLDGIDPSAANIAVVQEPHQEVPSIFWRVPPGERVSQPISGGLPSLNGSARLVKITYGSSITYEYESTLDDGVTVRWAIGEPVFIEKAPFCQLPVCRSDVNPLPGAGDGQDNTVPVAATGEAEDSSGADDNASANALAAGVMLLTMENGDDDATTSASDANDVVRHGESPDDIGAFIEELPIYEVHDEQAYDENIETLTESQEELSGEGGLISDVVQMKGEQMLPE